MVFRGSKLQASTQFWEGCIPYMEEHPTSQVLMLCYRMLYVKYLLQQQIELHSSTHMQAEVLSQFKMFAFRINHLLKRIEITNPNIIRKIVQKFEYVEKQKQHLQYYLLVCKIHHLNRCLSMKSYFQWSLVPKAPLEANLQHSGAYSHRTGAAGGSPKW